MLLENEGFDSTRPTIRGDISPVNQDNIHPPFRAEHVGSFPRPDRLLTARQAYSEGKLSREDLKRTEADCIREIVALQERVGIGVVTDGEYPKTSWREFLFEKCDGFDSKPTVPDFKFQLYDGTQFDYPGEPRVIGKIRRLEPLSAEDFSVLNGLTRRPTKANLPTPSIAHMGGDRLLDRSVYPDRQMFFADLAGVMREEIADLARRGCTYLQMDEVPVAVLCDPKNREIVKRRGEDPEELIDDYIDAINESIKGRPANMTVCVHLCRGNRDHGMADGGYEPVAERLFNKLSVDGFFLEYDTPRAGDFTPLRFVPKGTKRVVLGLVSTKLPDLESVGLLKKRIEEAARFVSIEQLGLSPQCGFASSARSKPLPMDLIERKLARIVEVADQVWR
jgi:5-methyltetrahydropteroyltriglutamate--homocysteine methyltransferase